MSTDDDNQARGQYLSFFIGDEEFGLGILEAREIIQYPVVTRVPSMPPSIRGVINLRGSVVPVLDLGVLFGTGERPTSKWSCIVVVETELATRGGTMQVGIVVDSVSQVIDLTPDDIGAPPAFGTQVKRRFLKGMGRLDDKFVLLLDLERVLAEIDVDPAAAAADEETPTDTSSSQAAEAAPEPAATPAGAEVKEASAP